MRRWRRPPYPCQVRNMRSVLPATFTPKAIMAAAVSGRVEVMPTRNARKARKGNEKAIPPEAPVEVCCDGIVYCIGFDYGLQQRR